MKAEGIGDDAEVDAVSFPVPVALWVATDVGAMTEELYEAKVDVTDATTSETVMVRVEVDVEVKVVVRISDWAQTKATKRESSNAERPRKCILKVVVCVEEVLREACRYRISTVY